MKKFLAVLLIFLLSAGVCLAESAEERMYISVIAKGFQHQYWQTVRAGAQFAAEVYNVEICFDGPETENDPEAQAAILEREIAKKPAAVALAALSAEAVSGALEQCVQNQIPVIGFDSGIPDAPEGTICATASTDNQAAAALAAEKIMEQEGFKELLSASSAEKPVVIAVISQDAASVSIKDRTTGFVERMKELAAEYNTVSVTGHALWADETEDAGVVIHVQISESTDAGDVAKASSEVLSMENVKAVFLSNEGAAKGFLAATDGREEIYEDVIVAGFDAGAEQKAAVRNGWFIGAVAQDPYMIGYYAVELAVKAAGGEEVADIDTGAHWYDASNIDDEMISMLIND